MYFSSTDCGAHNIRVPLRVLRENPGVHRISGAPVRLTPLHFAHRRTDAVGHRVRRRLLSGFHLSHVLFPPNRPRKGRDCVAGPG